jgi:hypothetical protein
MFGNTKGWGISALIVVVIGLLIFFMGKPPQISPPTKSIPMALASAALSVDPATLGIKPTGTDADAHDLYFKIIDDYAQNHFSYEKYEEVKKLAADKPEFLQWIVDAADCNKATLFGRKPDLIINYENQLDAIVALKAAGLWADNLGLYLVAEAIEKKKGFDEADKYLKGAFILGERLYYERLRWDEFTAGTELMTKAAYAMQREAVAQKDDARVAQLDAFQTAANDYNTKIVSAWQAISGIGGNPLSCSGDMFDIAANSKEPMWRVEATLKLGRMHYMENVTPGDQRGAVRILKQMADSADIVPVRTAAEKARDLTVDDFRKYGGGS